MSEPIFPGVADAPTPSTDQLLQVGVMPLNSEKTAADGKTTPREAYAYYVAPGGIVVGPRDRPTRVSVGAAKRRAVHNPVYKVSGFVDDDEKTKAQELLKGGNFRVFGVAYDGVSVANAINARENPDACGRFSVMFAGVATISVPYKMDGSSMVMEKAKIGDVVVVNPWAAPTFKFRGDPDNFHGWGVGIVDRGTWLKFCASPHDNTALKDVCHAAFGETQKYPNEYSREEMADILSQLVLGYVQDTGGSSRNEVRVQLQMNHMGVPVHTGVADGSTKFVDKDTAVTAGFIDVGGAAPTTSSKFISTMVDMTDGMPAEPHEGSPEQSVIGVTAIIGAGNTLGASTVGTMSTTGHLTAKGAGRLAAHMPASEIGVPATGADPLPGTPYAELTQAGAIDGDSVAKAATRAGLVDAIHTKMMPSEINGIDTKTNMYVRISDDEEAAVGGIPTAVHAACMTRAGDAAAPSKMLVAVTDAKGDALTTAAPNNTINPYPDTTPDWQARRFAKIVKEGVKRSTGRRQLHLLSDEQLSTLETALREDLESR